MLALLLATSGCDGGRPSAAQAADRQQQIERGRVLLAQYQCGSCHTIPGVADARGRQAGTLDAFGSRSYIAGRLPNELPVLAAWIADPRALVPATTMPAMGASADDALAMAAYLNALE
jgi:mono/diheme cytochrome c family protein